MQDTKTISLCHICYRHCEAERITTADGVYLNKTCVEHGSSSHLIETDINIYNSLVNLSRNKDLYISLNRQDNFSDRLTFFLIHFAFFLKNYKNEENKEILQKIYLHIATRILI